MNFVLSDQFYSLIFVSDIEAPVVLSCPNGTVSNTDPKLATANISWIEPEAMDNSGSVTRSSSYSPGYGFPIGRTLVTYVFSDASNNEVECVFNVTVLGNAQFVTAQHVKQFKGSGHYW